MTELKNCETGAYLQSLEETDLRRRAEAGIRVGEISLTWNWEKLMAPDYTAVVRLSQSLGLRIRSFHLPFGPEIDFTTKDYQYFALKIHGHLIRRAGAAGIPYVVIHPSSEPLADVERHDRMERCCESLGRLADVAAENGVQVCVENLPRTCLGRDAGEMAYILASDGRLRACFDVNHLLADTHANMIRAIGGRLSTVHISDYDFVDERHWMPGEGKIDWQEIRALLEEADYTGPFLYECRPAARRSKELSAFPLSAYRTIHENIAAGRPAQQGL